MQTLTYQGEHLWIFYLGHLLIVLAFFSALFAVFSFLKLTDNKNREDWHKALSYSYYVHGISIIGIIALLISIMYFHFFEFHYVWAHVSDELPTRYILAAFWEGQEGSFLLWMFWNVVLGWWFASSGDKIKQGVLAIILLVNAVLVSMILGVYIGDNKIGSNPFILLRHTMDIPLFQNAEYTKLLKGNGLNPLLQNYWMIIHPPTLFLGFASTIVPFAFAISSLHFKEYKTWLKTSLPWALFSAALLGTGILMGGAWAYEALSFGGYWAWDPVENMSLVPWLVLVAGIHLHLIAMHTSYSIKTTYLFYFLSFILVVYSSFLTRSGILGDSSAHAFTQMGLEWQLIFFLLLVIIISLVYYLKNSKLIPTLNKEELGHSREFWMFIGSLVLLFSAGLMSFTTSIPVYNKILDLLGSIFSTSFVSWHRAAPLDPVQHHNHFQIWIGILIGLFSGCALFLRYIGEKNIKLHKQFWQQLLIIVLISCGLFAILYSTLQSPNWPHLAFFFSGIFCFVSAIWYFIKILQFRLKSSAAFMSHAGFGLLLIGIVFTGLNKKYISNNLFAQQDLQENLSSDDLLKHITLIKNEPMFMNGYWVNYATDTFIGKSRIYTIDFLKEAADGNLKKEFNVNPEIQYDNKMTKVAASNPSIIRKWNKDIFTLIAQIPASQMDAESAKKAEDTLRYKSFLLQKDDSIITEKHIIKLRNTHTKFELKDFSILPGDKSWQYEIEIKRKDGDSLFVAKPAVVFRDQLVYKFPEKIDRLGVKMQIPDSLYDQIIELNLENNYTAFELKKEETYKSNSGFEFKLIDFIQDPKSPDYIAEPGDIAIAAKLEVKNIAKNESYILHPIFVIRKNQSFGIPTFNSDNTVQLRFIKIDPQSEKMTFEYGLRAEKTMKGMPIEIAENAPRTDYIVMEAFEFPGISFVWLGSIMMCAGLGLGAYARKKTKDV